MYQLSEEAKANARRTLPSYMVDSVIGYFEEGLPPGSFLRAVLENKLLEAYLHADDTNTQYLRNYVEWLYNHAPARSFYGCWGSEQAVNDYLAQCQKEREADCSNA